MDTQAPVTETPIKNGVNGDHHNNDTGRLSISSGNSDQKQTQTVPELKKKLKILKTAIKEERKTFQQQREDYEHRIREYEVNMSLNQSNTLSSSYKYNDFDKLPQEKSLLTEESFSPNKSQLSSSNLSVQTDKLLGSVQSSLYSGMAKYYKSPQSSQIENGEVYDFFYSVKQINLLKHKVEKKQKQLEDYKIKLDEKEKENDMLKGNNSQNMHNIQEVPERQSEFYISPEQYQQKVQENEQLQKQLESLKLKLVAHEQENTSDVQKSQEQQDRIQSQNEQIRLLGLDVREANEKLQNFESEKEDFIQAIQNLEQEKVELSQQIEKIHEEHDEILKFQKSEDQYSASETYKDLLEKNIARLNGQIKDLKALLQKKDQEKLQLINEKALLKISKDKTINDIDFIQKENLRLVEDNQELQNSVSYIELSKVRNLSTDTEKQFKKEGQIENDKVHTVMFLRVNEFKEYIIQYETSQQSVVIEVRNTVTIKAKEQDNNLQFSFIHKDPKVNNGEKQLRTTFECHSSQDFRQITSKITNFIRQGRQEIKDRQRKYEEQQLNQDKHQFFSAVKNFFKKD